MFFTFLNRENFHSIDLSSLLNYKPEQIIHYYYNDYLELPFESFAALQQALDADGQPDAIALEWLQLMEEDLQCSQDLITLKNNDFIQQLGPYYYPATNTRFYFKRETLSAPLTATDFAILLELKNTPATEQILHKYNKTRKNAKKIARNKEELLEDINMCITALQETEKLNRHINYLNKFLERRYSIVEQEALYPPEPDNLPEKPQKAPEIERGTLNNLIPFNRSRQKQATPTVSTYNHDMKVYFIRYREYEKACDRFKKALEHWTAVSGAFMDACLKDIEQIEHSIKAAKRMLGVYNNIISRSYVHMDYQDVKTLSAFKQFLETGRCLDLQDCMNVYLEEKHWSEIKASQDRIENTIYFLQNSSEYSRFADQKINEMFKRINPKPQEDDPLPDQAEV